MPESSRQALIAAYQAQIDWLIVQAEEFETGQRKVIGIVGGRDVDISANYAAEYRHKAGNMKAIMQAYERLHAKEPLRLGGGEESQQEARREGKSIRASGSLAMYGGIDGPRLRLHQAIPEDWRQPRYCPEVNAARRLHVPLIANGPPPEISTRTGLPGLHIGVAKNGVAVHPGISAIQRSSVGPVPHLANATPPSVPPYGNRSTSKLLNPHDIVRPSAR